MPGAPFQVSLPPQGELGPRPACNSFLKEGLPGSDKAGKGQDPDLGARLFLHPTDHRDNQLAEAEPSGLWSSVLTLRLPGERRRSQPRQAARDHWDIASGVWAPQVQALAAATVPCRDFPRGNPFHGATLSILLQAESRPLRQNTKHPC